MLSFDCEKHSLMFDSSGAFPLFWGVIPFSMIFGWLLVRLVRHSGSDGFKGILSLFVTGLALGCGVLAVFLLGHRVIMREKFTTEDKEYAFFFAGACSFSIFVWGIFVLERTLETCFALAASFMCAVTFISTGAAVRNSGYQDTADFSSVFTQLLASLSVVFHGTDQKVASWRKNRKDLVVRLLQGIFGAEQLEKQLFNVSTLPHVLWSTMTTEKPNVDTIVPIRKIADFLKAGMKVSILFRDVTEYLQDKKTTWEKIGDRILVHEHVIKSLLQSLEVPIDKLHFIRGTTYQLSREYTFDLLRLCGQVSQRDARKAVAEVKQVESPLLSELLYPLLQALDEQYLKVDGQFGGVDQRKIFILAEEQLPKLKLSKRWHLMNPMVPCLTGGKMSSSEIDLKIDLLDSLETVAHKISSAACPRMYTSFEEIKADFVEGKVSEEHLKTTLKKLLCELLTKVQSRCNNDVVRNALEKGYQRGPKRKIPEPDLKSVDLDEVQEQTVQEMLVDSETIGDDHSLRSAVAEGRPVRILIPLHPKGRFHLGFLSSLLKLKEFANKGIDFKAFVLISDAEGFLDPEAKWASLNSRRAYLRSVCETILKVTRLEDLVVVEDDQKYDEYFRSPYILDFYEITSSLKYDNTKIVDGTTISANLAPVIYALNIKLVKPDLVIVGGSSDVVRVAKLAREILTGIGFPSPVQIILGNTASRPDFFLYPFASPKLTKSNLARYFSAETNSLLHLCQYVVFPLLGGEDLLVSRLAKRRDKIRFEDFHSLKIALLSNRGKRVDAELLKESVINVINNFFRLVREELPGYQQLVAEAFHKNKYAYPPT